jgi:hypothetical protein
MERAGVVLFIFACLARMTYGNRPHLVSGMRGVGVVFMVVGGGQVLL